MHPPPGFEPSLTALLDAAIPTALSTATSLLPSLTSAALASTTSITTSYKDPTPENGECRLLGPFAIFVQGALGCLALLALVYKRWKERPQRPLKIWFFDVSKQVVGSVLVHIANLLMSMLSSGQFSIKLEPGIVSRMVDANGKYRPNPCSFYLLNLAIDTTIGIPILIFLLRIFTALFSLAVTPRESIQSGNYGNPPRAYWWFKQSMIYFLGLMGMKICVLIIFFVLPWISRVGDWALRWTEGDEALQVIFVMLVFPVIMNATQYYIIDSFIKNQKPSDHELIPDVDGGEHEVYDEALDRDSQIDGESSDDEDPELKAKVQDIKKKSNTIGSGSTGSSRPGSGGRKEYDPQFDGESESTAVGSTSTSGRKDVEEER